MKNEPNPRPAREYATPSVYVSALDGNVLIKVRDKAVFDMTVDEGRDLQRCLDAVLGPVTPDGSR